jgi:uncharacterized protein YbbK (DUF523 family)
MKIMIVKKAAKAPSASPVCPWVVEGLPEPRK